LLHEKKSDFALSFGIHKLGSSFLFRIRHETLVARIPKIILGTL
jgi:hypothetical protein